MHPFVEGLLLPFTTTGRALRLGARALWNGYKAYARLVDGLGNPWADLIHSTVFMSLGSTIAALLLH